MIKEVFNIRKIFNIIAGHKIISAALILIFAGGLYFVFKKGGSSEAMYAFAKVERGDLIVFVSGTGQIAANRQIDIKPEISGILTYVGAKSGQQVKRGQALAYLDSESAQRAVRDAEINLESAEMSMEKLKRNRQSASQTAMEDLSRDYRDAYNKTSDSFLELPNLIELARGALYDNAGISSVCDNNICAYGNLADVDFKPEFVNMIDRAKMDYADAKTIYDPVFESYRRLRLDASSEEIVDILKKTKKTTESLAQAIKSEQNMLDALVSNINDNAAKQGRKGQIPSQITNYQNNIGSALGKLNNIVLILENANRTIDSLKKSIEDSAIIDPIDIKNQENIVLQKKAALEDAKDNLAKHAIYAPFDGIVEESDAEQGDSVSQNTAIATIFTEQAVVEMMLNEIDAVKIKIGQKAIITFDAIEDLTITGKILEIDSIGAANQGVVSYGVKIGLDAQDKRIKPAMTVSVNIITENRQNVILVPNSAVKFANNLKYVQVPSVALNNNKFTADMLGGAEVALDNLPDQKMVETGLSNDFFTEITNGLTEGDIIITRVIASSSDSNDNSQGGGLFPVGGQRNTNRQGGLRIQTR